MHHLVFVYGTLRRGEVNHRLLRDAAYLGPHRTEPCFAMFALGAYPGVTRNGSTAIAGEIFRVNARGLSRLDHLEDHPRLYDRILIPSPHGRAWIYLFRGRVAGRMVIRSGDWRDLTAGTAPIRAAARRRIRDPKNPRWRDHVSG
jgi:gamma-glutamylcyclotransferase (GGCT)/AIG2-like uncharacterized protein YtfP